jgi:GntR family transcriptional regulator
MLITLERNSGVPVFRQICEQVRFQVAAGVLGSGAEVPSTRDLAATLGINPMTVSKAYALLEQEGVLERRPGLSLMVRSRSRPAGGDARHEELARLLRPAAAAARQLGIEPQQALELYRKALEAPGDDR